MSRNHAKVKRAALLEEIESKDWDEILHGDSLDCWSKFCQYLEQLESKYVPMKRVRTVGGRRKSIWMTKRALNLIVKKRKVYSKYKDNNHPACIQASNKAHREVKGAKRNFEKLLAHNIKEDSKSFYAYVRSKSKSRKKPGPLGSWPSCSFRRGDSRRIQQIFY